MSSPEYEPIALPVEKAAKLIGRSRVLLYQEIQAGRLKAYEPQRGYATNESRKLGRKPRPVKYVLIEDLKAWVTNGEPSPAKAPAQV